jgi:ClpP class serine protease
MLESFPLINNVGGYRERKMTSQATKKKTSKKKTEEPTPATEAAPTCEPAPSPLPEAKPTAKDSKKKFYLNELIDAMLTSLGPDAPSGSSGIRDDLIRAYLQNQIESNPLAESYNILILHDEGRMVKSDADNIYSASIAFPNKRPVLLVLYSTGGVIGSAYLIGKLCREYAEGKFVVVVPRQAKSAATLICCAADEIHMGSLSELGPIDPQIEDLPALGLKTSVEHIADLIKDYPHASDMFAKYLNMSLKPIHLGYFERVAESAAQYAERLLNLHPSNLKQKPAEIAKALVYSYKDHGFVIDKAEACDIFGDKIIRTDTEEYKLGNSIYAALMFVARVASAVNHYFYFIGSLSSDPHFTKRQTS